MKTATAAQWSEMDAVFCNNVTIFTECLTEKSQINHDNNAQAPDMIIFNI